MVARRKHAQRARLTATAAATAQLLSVAALLLLLSASAARAAAAADADAAVAVVPSPPRNRTRRARAAAAYTNATTLDFGDQANTTTRRPRTAVLDAAGQFYFRNGTAVPRDVSGAALRRAALLGLDLRPTSPLDGAREATAMGAYGAAPVKLQYPGEPSFNGITGPLGSIDYDAGDGGECFRYLPGCLACDKFYTVAPGVGALFQYRCLACLQPEYVLNGIKCECGPGFGIPATLGLSGGPKPGRGAKWGYGGQATMFTSCQRCPAAFFLDPAFSSDGTTLGPACIRCPRNTKANPDQSGCECSAGAAPVRQLNVQGDTPLTLEPPRCVMCPAGTYVPSPNRGNYGCIPCQEGTTTPPGRFGMISTRLNGNGKDVCDWCLPGWAGNPAKYKVPSNGVTILLEGVVCVRCLDDGLDQPALKGDVICVKPADV